MNDEQRRTAFITGGTRGIGAAIAQRLAAAGFTVVVTYANDDEQAGRTIAALRASGYQATALRADVSDEQAMRAVFAEIPGGTVDVVVNAAGVMPLGTLVDSDLSDLDRVLRTNVRGTAVVDKLAATHVRAGGAIINLSSSVTRFANPGNFAYTASKGAVEAMTMTLARELRGRDITVNTVAPGAIATEMLDAWLGQDTGQRRAQLAAQSPLERLGTPQDIAEVVVFLATTGRWINGQVLYANGGAI